MGWRLQSHKKSSCDIKFSSISSPIHPCTNLYQFMSSSFHTISLTDDDDDMMTTAKLVIYFCQSGLIMHIYFDTYCIWGTEVLCIQKIRADHKNALINTNFYFIFTTYITFTFFLLTIHNNLLFIKSASWTTFVDYLCIDARCNFFCNEMNTCKYVYFIAP